METETTVPGLASRSSWGAARLWPLYLGIGYMAALSLDQAHWWRLKDDYSFGWLVPLFVGYLLWERWPLVSGRPPESPERPLAPWLARLLDGGMWVLLLCGSLAFLFGALYRAVSGPTQPGSLALSLGFALLFPALLYLGTSPGTVKVDSGLAWRRDAQIERVWCCLFPCLIWLISAPLVSAAENAVSLFLLRKVVKVVFFVFSTLGYPLIQEGNVLVLPLGRVGVADACSGIRSLTGCLFAGSFLAAVFLDRTWKKMLLIFLAVALAILANFLRSLFLTSWAYAYGSEAIEGTLHDATGYAVLGVTTVALFSLLPLFDETRWKRWLSMDPAEEKD